MRKSLGETREKNQLLEQQLALGEEISSLSEELFVQLQQRQRRLRIESKAEIERLKETIGSHEAKIEYLEKKVGAQDLLIQNLHSILSKMPKGHSLFALPLIGELTNNLAPEIACDALSNPEGLLCRESLQRGTN